MKENTLDRRIRKTRKLLLTSLTELMKEKEVKDISVKELTALADINRGTFYLHYRDVFDMLSSVENEFFQEFNKILDIHSEKSSPEQNLAEPFEILKQIFTFLYENKELTSALVGPHGDLAFLNKLTGLVQERIQFAWSKNQPGEDYFYYNCAFLIHGCIGIIQAWMKHDYKESPLRLSEITDSLLKKGIGNYSS